MRTLLFCLPALALAACTPSNEGPGEPAEGSADLPNGPYGPPAAVCTNNDSFPSNVDWSLSVVGAGPWGERWDVEWSVPNVIADGPGSDLQVGTSDLLVRGRRGFSEEDAVADDFSFYLRLGDADETFARLNLLWVNGEFDGVDRYLGPSESPPPGLELRDLQLESSCSVSVDPGSLGGELHCTEVSGQIDDTETVLEVLITWNFPCAYQGVAI